MQVPDNGIDLAEFGQDLGLTLIGFIITIGVVVLVLAWIARDEHETS